MKSGPISGFKAYDLRGRIPAELNEDVAYRIGRAYAEFVSLRKVIVGRDIRLSSEELSPRSSRACSTPASTCTTSASAARKSSTTRPSPAGWTAASWSPPATTRPTTTA